MKLNIIKNQINEKLRTKAVWHWDDKTIFVREFLDGTLDILNNLANLLINYETNTYRKKDIIDR